MDWISITAVAILILLWLLWRNYRYGGIEKVRRESRSVRSDRHSGVCKSPSCARCQSQAHDATLIKQQLMDSFIKHKQEVFNSDSSQQPVENPLPRVLHTINSIDNKLEILWQCYDESGYEFDSSELQPHIWWMPGLNRSAFWNVSDHLELQELAAVFESLKTLELLQLEYTSACSKPLQWKENSVPNGSWQIFHLYDQGCRVSRNCSVCPQTMAFLDSVPGLMRGCVYGNAMISVLGAGSEIEAHTGPCNFRLRCHLALTESDNYMIQVGSEVRSWELGKLMVFDDSFVHRVWHEGGQGDKERVVLIFDVWHLDVRLEERHSLKHLFHSDHSWYEH